MRLNHAADAACKVIAPHMRQTPHIAPLPLSPPLHSHTPPGLPGAASFHPQHSSELNSPKPAPCRANQGPYWKKPAPARTLHAPAAHDAAYGVADGAMVSM